MFDIRGIKVAVFDFDDTLCIHTSRPLPRSHEVDLLYNTDIWSHCVAPKAMRNFILMCVVNDIKLCLMPGTSSYQRSIAKVDWVKARYGVDMENCCVGSQGHKVQMLCDIRNKYMVGASQILYVDDMFDNLEEAAGKGFTACSPMEIVHFMEG